MGPHLSAGPFGFSRVVFLSHVLTAATPVFPGDPRVEITLAATTERDGYYLQRLACGEQSGTHWAAAAHFHAGEPAADELEAADFFLPAVVLDCRAQAAADADFAVGVADLAGWEAEHGRIGARAAVLALTGYDRKYADPAAYLGADDRGGMHYPGFGADAAAWLIAERGIAALGTDTMGVDPGADATFATNKLLLRGRRMHLENLRGLDQMPAAGGWVVVGGPRIAAGSGSPATVFGLVP
jgi:kynurenine formamidase